MSIISKLSAVAAGAILTIASAPAQADAPTYGSAVFIGERDCGTRLPTVICAGSGTHFIYQDTFGGPDQGVDVLVGDPQGIFGSSNITFGSEALPEIHQAAAAPGNVRVNVSAFAFNSFTYEGDAPTELSYAGDLHIVDSSPSPSNDADQEGGSGYYGWVAIWDPSLVADFTDAFTAATTYGGYDCSTAGVLGFGYAIGALSGGETSIHIATQGCSGSPVVINPGQTVLAAAWLQTPVNRYGWVDASHTFTMDYDPELSAEVRANLAESMVAGYSAVPEPATWAMMILGFGLVGAVARLRVGQISA